MAQTLIRTCLRLAVDPSQGQGWSEYCGSAWVEPVEDCGATLITDNNRRQRMVVEDRTDGLFWELATFNQNAYSGPSFLDKDVSGTGTNIASQKMFGEDVAAVDQQHDRIELLESHAYVKPYDSMNVGKTGYSATGFPTGFTVDVEMYVDGVLRTKAAEDTAIPDSGDITFSGYKCDARRIQHRLKFATSEYRATGYVVDYLSKPSQGTPAQRKTGNGAAQLALANLILWATRDGRLAYDRINKKYATRTGITSAGATAPTSRQAGSFSSDANADHLSQYLFNDVKAVSSGTITVMYWGSGGVYTRINGAHHTDFSPYGNAVNGFALYYRVISSIALTSFSAGGGSIFDIRVLSGDASAYLADYYNDIVNNDGKSFLPGY